MQPLAEKPWECRLGYGPPNGWGDGDSSDVVTKIGVKVPDSIEIPNTEIR